MLANDRSANAKPNGTVAVEVEGLSKSFDGKVVVRNLSMRVLRGQIYGFLGPNGSGKTTTLRMVCGLLTPDGGRGTALGYDILTERDKIKRHVGYMTQRFSLYQDLSIQENLEFVARVYGLPSPEKEAQAAIERLGLMGRERQLAGTLSGGWKQRLALGACILPKPELLLLDEPTAGVDPKARREFWGEIHKLAADGMTVLVSTHYMDEAERCHEIAYIAYGELLARGTIPEVIEKSHLKTYTVSGPDLQSLAETLTGIPGIDMVAPFGTSLHVAGRDAAALDAAVARFRDRPDLDWTPSQPSLEDVFIDLMSRSQDNFR
jgi:ABC-2 type transport system ATP-binding protein